MINQKTNNETMDQLIQNFENLTINKKEVFRTYNQVFQKMKCSNE